MNVSHCMPEQRSMAGLRRSRVVIDLDALRHNLEVIKRAAPDRRVFAVVKADAYGHGMVACARALHDEVEGFVVATLGEAEALRKAGITRRMMVLQGFADLAGARLAARLMVEPVVHQPWQADILQDGHIGPPLRVWLKIDTGMHRMGLTPDSVAKLHAWLMASGRVRAKPGLMTHFARADEKDDQSTPAQLSLFNSITAGLVGERSLANSAALFAGWSMPGEIVRPGIALYGGNPLDYGTASALGLRPVMRLTTRLLAVKRHRKGEAIGYGGAYVCPEDMPVGVAAIGYGDGYPRHAQNGTPVIIQGQRARLIGRVSMDLITLDLRGVEARPGDEVELWGPSLPVDEVAACAGTLSYELLCAVGGRIDRHFIQP